MCHICLWPLIFTFKPQSAPSLSFVQYLCVSQFTVCLCKSQPFNAEYRTFLAASLSVCTLRLNRSWELLPNGGTTPTASHRKVQDGPKTYKIQSVPRSKHTTSRLHKRVMEIIAVCSQIHTKHINTLCGQNVELFNVQTVGTQRILKVKSSLIYRRMFKFVSFSFLIAARCFITSINFSA